MRRIQTQSSISTSAVRQRLESLAEEEIGTAYAFGQMVPGQGFDCIQLMRYVGEKGKVLKVDRRSLRGLIPYSRWPQRREIVRVLDIFLKRIPDDEDLEIGDVALFASAPRRSSEIEPAHLGLVVSHGRLIHASGSEGRVLRHAPKPEWRLIGGWRFPGLADDG